MSNQGTLDAFNVELEDYFVEGELILNDAQWAQTGSGVAMLNNDIAFIGVGEKVSVNVSFIVDPDYMGTFIVNYAEIKRADDNNNPNDTDPLDADSTPDDNQGDDELANDGELVDSQTGALQDDDPDSDDYDPAPINIVQDFDLALVKTMDDFEDSNNNGAIDAGEKVTFTVTVYNQGTLDATDIEVVDYVPSDMFFNAVDNLDFSSSAPGSPTAPIAEIASLEAGQSASLSIVLIVDSEFMGASIINNAEIISANNILGLPDSDSTSGR